MKKFLPYTIAAVAFIALLLLMIGAARNRPKVFDDRISMRQRDKIPYGYYAAYNLLPSLFPKAIISTNRKPPGNWQWISSTKSNQVVILTGVSFNADEEECEELLQFAKKENQVFIITHYLSSDARAFFLHRSEIYDDDGIFTGNLDSLQVQLSQPRFRGEQHEYPGRRFASYFSAVDTSRTVVLGKNERGYPNFIQFKAGKGNIYLHLAPLAFSNYFILHEDNIQYFEKALSVLPRNSSRILWNEYYMVKPQQYPKDNQPSWLHILFRYPPLKWGLLTAFATLLLFVLLEMRRRQRSIPVIPTPKNESLDFVQTIGRLYYDKGDHYDLVKKMTNYFLDYVRSHYSLNTGHIDEGFIQALHAKTAYPVSELKEIFDFIHYSERTKTISEQQLSQFYFQLEKFYQST
ncbi:MAG: hypothetical protein ICV81_06500 [Flavisolibacter sp.]|nr:hypothetical protein [Flavisolibacter sp.]